MASEDETLNLNGENTEETSNIFNFKTIMKILAVLAVFYIIYTFFKSDSSSAEYTPVSAPIEASVGSSTFDVVSTAFGH